MKLNDKDRSSYIKGFNLILCLLIKCCIWKLLRVAKDKFSCEDYKEVGTRQAGRPANFEKLKVQIHEVLRFGLGR